MARSMERDFTAFHVPWNWIIHTWNPSLVFAHVPIYMVILDVGRCLIPCVPDVSEGASTTAPRRTLLFLFLEMLTAPMLSR